MPWSGQIRTPTLWGHHGLQIASPSQLSYSSPYRYTAAPPGAWLCASLCFSANVQGKKERITGRYERKQQCWKIHIPCGDFYINNITLTSEPEVFLATLESRQNFFSILQVEETTWGHKTRVIAARCRFRFNYLQKLYDFWYHLLPLQEVLGKGQENRGRNSNIDITAMLPILTFNRTKKLRERLGWQGE